MPWQALDKRRPSDWLAAIGVHAGHPPLTSLRSFAPPYASRRGRTDFSHSSNTLSFRARHPVIPSEARNLPPFAKRKGG